MPGPECKRTYTRAMPRPTTKKKAASKKKTGLRPDDFRRLALRLPETTEGAHMGHPDFRVRNKIFATLWADGLTGMVALTPEQQRAFVDTHAAMFEPVKGGWGLRGATQVHLAQAKEAPLRHALYTAWRGKAPESLADPAAT
jgi:hypothetical protein